MSRFDRITNTKLILFNSALHNINLKRQFLVLIGIRRTQQSRLLHLHSVKRIRGYHDSAKYSTLDEYPPQIYLA